MAAPHADGSQKLTRNVSDWIRSVNPQSAVLQYRHADNGWRADVRNADWQRCRIDELARRLDSNDFDGAFLDTAHVRWDGLTPDAWWEDFRTPEYHSLPGCRNPPTRPYFEALAARFRAGPNRHSVVANMGPLVAEAHAPPLVALDRGMVEHFMNLGGVPVERGDG